jgi:hypothetical protein
MSDFEVARLITVLGARFDPRAFDQFTASLEHAAQGSERLRQVLGRAYPTAALNKYQHDVEALQAQLVRLQGYEKVLASGRLGSGGAMKWAPAVASSPTGLPESEAELA